MKKSMKKNIKNIFYIVLEICMIFSIIYIFKYCYDMYSINKQSNLLNKISIDETSYENATTGDEQNSNNENAENNVNENEKDTEKEVKTERMLKVEKLQKQNSEIVGWVEIEDTNINYPVLQASDNSYYLTHNYEKKYSKSGSIFLDKDYVWDPPSSNLLMYGHDRLLKNIIKYKDKSFYDKHPNIKFTTTTEDANYEIIAAFYSRVYYTNEKNVFRYYYFVNSKDEKEYNEFVKNAKEASVYDTGKTAKYGDQLITLSTCSYHTKDGRFAVVARKSY